MINKGQWLVLPYSSVRHLPGLRISLPGVVPQWECHPHWIVDYSWWNVNQEILPLAAIEAMQFGHALDRILREILLANPCLGPIALMKLNISNGFYHIALNVNNVPKLGVAFPTPPRHEPLIAFPLVLPMGWKKNPPIFSTATKTIADLTNIRIQNNVQPHQFILLMMLRTPLSCQTWPHDSPTQTSSRETHHFRLHLHHLHTQMFTLTTLLPPHRAMPPSVGSAGSSYTPLTMSSGHSLRTMHRRDVNRCPSKNWQQATAPGAL